MSEAFVPFGINPSASSKAAAPFRAKIVSAQNTAALPFKAALLPHPAPAPHSTSHGPAQISLTREGEKIIAIRVICGCGEVTELKCVY